MPLEITLDGRSLLKQNLSVPARGALSKEYTLRDERGGAVQATLHCRDALECDNRASCPLEGVYAGRVFLCSATPDPFLLAALGVHREVELFEVNKNKVSNPGEIGLAGDILVCRNAPAANLPEKPHLIVINPQASGNLVSVAGRAVFKDAGVRVNARRPAGARRGLGPPGRPQRRQAYAAPSWAETLVESADGTPLVLAGVTGGRKAAIVAFDISATTLTTDRGYAIFLANLLHWMLAPPEARQPGGLLDAGQTLLAQEALPSWLERGAAAASRRQAERLVRSSARGRRAAVGRMASLPRPIYRVRIGKRIAVAA